MNVLKIFLFFILFIVGCSSTYQKQSYIPQDFVDWQRFDNRTVWYSHTAKKPILIYFYSNNENSEKFSANLLRKEKIVLMINRNFTPIRLNSNKNKAKLLMENFDIRQAPAVIIISHVDQSLLLKTSGIPMPDNFYKNLKISLQMDSTKTSQGVVIKGE